MSPPPLALPGKQRHSAERYTSSRERPARSNHPISFFPAGPVNGRRVVTSVAPGACPTRRIPARFGRSTTGALHPEGKQIEQDSTRFRCSFNVVTQTMLPPLRDASLVPARIEMIFINLKNSAKKGSPMRYPSAIISGMAYGRRNRRKRSSQRTGFYVFAALVVLAVGALAYVGGSSIVDTTLRSDVDRVQRADDPTGAEAPEPVSDEAAEKAVDKAAKETAEAQNSEDEEEAAEAEAAQEEAALLAEEEAVLEEELPTEEGLPEDESAPAAPDDPTMYLSVPKLGISGAIVAGGEAGLELGAQLVSGAPWVQGSNTYIAGHRVGFPGTGSDRIFYDLPSMAAGDTVTLYDSLGQEYTYQVSEVFAVTPYDVWVTAPTGTDMVTLQVCTETPDDWTTIGPRLMSSGPESGRLIVRAVRV